MYQLHRTLPLLDHLFIFVFTYYISINNSMFWCLIFWDWMYYWWYIIYKHFLFKLGIFLFPLLTNSFGFFLNMWFLLYDSDSMSLRRYHFLPIFQSLLSHWGQCSACLGGELRKEVLLIMLSYFGNLVAFCLILIFFLLSMVIKEKFSKWKGRNWIFVFLLDLEFVLCLLKLMNCWNFYWIQP